MEKKVRFEVGKWYWFALSSTDNSFFRIIKCSAIERDRVRADYWLMNQNAKIGNKLPSVWMLSDIYSLKELSIEEIQQYLPVGHPDKIKSDGFKVGDYVVITKSSKNWISEMNTEVGKIVQITHISDTSCINYEEKPCWFFGARDGHFRHATPEEINNHLISIGQISDLIKQESEKYPFKPLKPGDLEWEIQVPQITTHGIMWCEPAPMTEDNWKNKMILSIDDEELPMVNIIKTNTIKQLLNNE